MTEAEEVFADALGEALDDCGDLDPQKVLRILKEKGYVICQIVGLKECLSAKQLKE
jgi:hypothetical protein